MLYRLSYTPVAPAYHEYHRPLVRDIRVLTFLFSVLLSDSFFVRRLCVLTHSALAAYRRFSNISRAFPSGHLRHSYLPLSIFPPQGHPRRVTLAGQNTENRITNSEAQFVTLLHNLFVSNFLCFSRSLLRSTPTVIVRVVAKLCSASFLYFNIYMGSLWAQLTIYPVAISHSFALPTLTVNRAFLNCALLHFSIERRWSSRTFRYGYLVTT